MDREARGGSIYEIRTWWQLPGMVCGKRSMRCCSKNDHIMRSAHRSTRWISQARGVAMHATGPCIQTARGRGVILHENETCSQPCGARGVAAHASRAMRSDTRAATQLVLDWLLFPINSPRPLSFENIQNT
ncbi:hypothetical protein F2Q69_00015688 [Brassica cretica]|uniref:Uncharacterized protein n=1 Tax=Brassica cretica TaxID=69181 RepID=A0A8S9QTK4_BRACR|nr:hypothetical protein F2Q69_00015688 [Brassica cretica]